MCYCKEEDPTVEVAIVRIGDLSKRSVAWFETRDISAKAGVKYTAMSGKLVFEPGEKFKFVHIPTTNDEAWDATLEFEVYAGWGEGGVGRGIGGAAIHRRMFCLDFFGHV